MENVHEHFIAILDAARQYVERGWPIIPLKGKIPAAEGWQQFEATPEAVNFWFGPERRANIGLRTGETGYIVVDTDTEDAEAWVRSHLVESPMQVMSGGGSKHRYYRRPPRKEIRNKQGWKHIPGLDIRGHGGFIVLPPSLHPDTGKPYEWLTDFLRPEELPVFSPSWVYERRKQIKTAMADVLDDKPGPGQLLYRGQRYVETFPPAVEHRNGHTTMFVSALKIVRFVRSLGGSEEDMWRLLLHYNARCRPPWDPSRPAEEKALRHKLADAQRIAK